MYSASAGSAIEGSRCFGDTHMQRNIRIVNRYDCFINRDVVTHLDR